MDIVDGYIRKVGGKVKIIKFFGYGVKGSFIIENVIISFVFVKFVLFFCLEIVLMNIFDSIFRMY